MAAAVCEPDEGVPHYSDAAAPTAPPGRIILLNGASSAGKSTLTRALQDALPTPFLRLSSDQLIEGGARPHRIDSAASTEWRAIRSQFFDGFQRSIGAFAAASNDLVVDHIIEYRTWRDHLENLLADFDVFVVGVLCDLDELDRRERARGERRIGEARADVEQLRVHELGAYDATVDTTAGVTREMARLLVERWAARPPRRGLPVT